MVFHHPPFDRLRVSGERPFSQCYPTHAILSENESNTEEFSALRWETQVLSSGKENETRVLNKRPVGNQQVL